MKILVIYATAGAGHRKAAEALYNGLKKTDHETVLVDSLDYTSRLYKQLYSRTYTFLISRLPWLWWIIYTALDIPWILPFVRLMRRGQNILHGRALHRYLKEEKFDYILSTHFFPNEVAAYLKRRGQIDSRILSVITDFDVHSIWRAEGIDLYSVASEWTQKRLIQQGISESNIAVTGIPTDEKFASHRDIKELKQRLGVKENVFTVLVATGSFGIGPIEEILEQLPDFQVIVVCGQNRSLYNRLNQYNKDLVKICGLVNNMDELMAVSDAMITKPGGLSISEALVSGLPLIFFNAIPGQETNNVRVLKEYGLGISGCRVEEIPDKLKRFQSHPEELKTVQEKTKFLARPAAVQDILALLDKGIINNGIE